MDWEKIKVREIYKEAIALLQVKYMTVRNIITAVRTEEVDVN